MKKLDGYKEAKALAAKKGLPAGPLSHSQISTYQMCPKSYEWKYIIKPEMVKLWAPPLVFGRAIHEGLENLGKTLMNQGKPMLKDAYRATELSFQKNLEEFGKIPREELVVAKRTLEGINKLIAKWYIDEMPELNPTGVEEKIYAILGDVPTTSKIDLINDGREVIDYKLTKRFKNEKDAKLSLQLSMYSAVTGVSGVGFCNMRFPNFTTKKKWVPEIKTARAIKNASDRQWAEDVVGSIADAILKGSFPLCDPASWKCSIDMCEFYAGCRGKEAVAVEQPNWMSGMLGDW